MLTVTLLLLVAGLPSAVRADAGPDDAEQNRRLLEKVRSDPQRYARLRQNLEAFLALSPDRQELMRQLDRDLHRKDSATQKRLAKVLERYTRWYDRLPDKDRQAIDEAPDGKARLRVIKDIREREWVERLPRAERDKVQNAKDPERQALIRALRQQQRKRRQEWQVALRHWPELIAPPPTHLADFPYGVKTYVNDYLRPLLWPMEEQRLKILEGKPGLPRLIVTLSDRHAVVLPGPPTGPSHFKDLPAEVRKPLQKLDPMTLGRLREAEGTWPGFAVWVSVATRAKGIKLAQELGPSRPGDFVSQVQQFIDKELTPRLSTEEQKRLKSAEGQWPLYPRVLLQLAAKHYLKVPGPGARLNLPGPAVYWDRFRFKAGGKAAAK
ncbi:MAG TPA: hypothetical protein VG013_16370 [Gemmataceae bacterium]|nr:hypothetical protein [Gemmataceae bacterium]